MKIIALYGQYKEIKVYNYFQVSAKMLINYCTLYIIYVLDETRLLPT